MDYEIFGKNDISDQLRLISDFYEVGSKLYTDLDEEALSYVVFGADSDPLYSKINELHYLLVLLLIIQEEMKRDISQGNTAPWYDKQFYIDKYGIECIRSSFMCANVNIQPFLALIDLHNLSAPGGIGHMFIEGNPDDSNAETFIVS